MFSFSTYSTNPWPLPPISSDIPNNSLLPSINSLPTAESPITTSVEDFHKSQEPPTTTVEDLHQSQESPVDAPVEGLQKSLHALSTQIPNLALQNVRRFSAVPLTAQQIKERMKQPYSWLNPMVPKKEQVIGLLKDVGTRSIIRSHTEKLHTWTEDDLMKLVQGLAIEELTARQVKKKYFPNKNDISIKKINSRYYNLKEDGKLNYYLSLIEEKNKKAEFRQSQEK